jgi:hypothetical protein
VPDRQGAARTPLQPAAGGTGPTKLNAAGRHLIRGVDHTLRAVPSAHWQCARLHEARVASTAHGLHAQNRFSRATPQVARIAEDPPMPARFDAQEFSTALRQLGRGKSNTLVNRPTSLHLACDEWKQSEEFRVRVIAARTKLKLMRDRSEALEESLQRFRSQQRSVISA